MNAATSMDPRIALRRLRMMFLAIPKALPTRPEPRHIFDNVARASNPLPPKGSDLADVYDSVMASAIATKDIHVIERTQFAIIEFHDQLLSFGLRRSPLVSTVAFEEIACTALHDTAEALTDIGIAGTTRTDGAIETAVRESAKAMVSLEAFRESAARIPRRQKHLSLSGR